MKVYNDIENTKLLPTLQKKLDLIRELKAFDAYRYIEAKANYLNTYMRRCNLKSCVIAVSGGIDSAIVLGIVKEAQKIDKTTIQNIVPVMLPATDNKGVTNQREASNRGFELCKALGLMGYEFDVNPAVQEIHENIVITGMKSDDWALGQLVPYTRTPFLYGITSLCSVEEKPGVLVGTTNRDEGAYLGYVGKASDGLVDVQLISDLHKSEVYAVAKALNLPDSIVNVTPAGDMYDNRTDTDVFGASYDFVELYLNYLNLSDYQKAQFTYDLYNEDYGKLTLDQFYAMKKNLDNLHKYNRHKYISRSPAVHLDLWDCSCPDGWINYYQITKDFMEGR